MKVRMEKSQIIFICVITTICVIAIGVAVYFQFFDTDNKNTSFEDVDTNIDDEELKNDFSNLFTNELIKDNSSFDENIKKDKNQDLIVTTYAKKENAEGKYELNVYIPSINLKNDIVNRYNEEIKKLFINKANSILVTAAVGTVYDVSYIAYLNNGILSLAIESTLKEGNNPQRVILKTYNYDINQQKEISIQEVLSYKKLEGNVVQDKIEQSIKGQIEQAKALNEIGYNVYHRDLRSDLYRVNNSNIFLLGKDNVLYILYPYGNSNYTTEMDIVVF